MQNCYVVECLHDQKEALMFSCFYGIRKFAEINPLYFVIAC